MKPYHEHLKDLRSGLYQKYNRKQLSIILNVSEVHVSRLLNGKTELKMFQYFKLQNLLGNFCKKQWR